MKGKLIQRGEYRTKREGRRRIESELKRQRKKRKENKRERELQKRERENEAWRKMHSAKKIYKD